MFVDLGKEALEVIVRDVVKDMMGQIAGMSNRKVKKNRWYIAVRNIIQEYQQNVKEEFLPVLLSDFSTRMVVKFSGNKLSEDDKEKIRKFMQMVKKSDMKSVEAEVLKKIDKLKENGGSEEWGEKMEAVKKVFSDGHTWILRKLELHIRSVISDAMYKNSVQRSSIEVMLYNFVDGEVPESVNKLLKNGMGSVPSTRLTKKEIDKRVDDALLEYLIRLGRRSICGHAVIQPKDIQDWITQVKRINIDQESKNFIETLETTLPALKVELDLVYCEMDLDSKEEIVEKLEKEGCVLVMCDKNMGMSLFTLETMRKADQALMKQLGAVRQESSKEEIMRKVMVDIKEFEKELTKEQREYLDSRYPGRQVDRREVAFPFLKCLHKIQKMSEVEIKNKDVTNIKFRPVVDAKQWLTRNYAEVVMNMMRNACNILVENGGEVMKGMKPKDGWRFAVEIREYEVQEEFDVNVTADIEEAYTNITDEMIKKAIVIVCRTVGFKDWKVEMMKKLVDLVLEENYAETSGGLYKFKKVLPMGYKLSGESLDIVALAEEMATLGKFGGDQEVRVKLGELRNYPEEFVNISIQQELSMSRGIKKFKRYVDDIHAQIAGTEEQILNGILALGFMYPQSLVLSVDLNIWHSSFLDAFVWKNLSSGTISTVMKRSADVPVGHVRRGSTHPEKYKLQSLLGEMLRGRRLASDEEMVALSDKCIAYEFQSIGYSRLEVKHAMEEAKKKVENNYSRQFVRINEDGERRYFSYGGGMIFNKNYQYAEVLLNYIENIKPRGEPGIMLLPDVKINRLAYTKKRYLERQEEDKKKTKS